MARMGRRAQERLLLVLIAVGLAFVLLDSARFFVRLDLTRNRAYTVSPATRAIFREIPERVSITYFLSDELRPLSPAPGRVIDLLQEYAAASRSRVSVSVVDPVRAGRTDSARRFGVPPQQVQVVRQNEQRTIDVFSGLVIEYLNRYTSLPAVFTPDGLEFSLSAGIRKLLAGRRLLVGVVLGRPGRSLEADYESLRTGLSRDYTLHEYLPGERVPPEVDALLVLGGQELPAADLQPIERYIREGGKALFAVKGLRVETARSFSASAVGASPLLDLLESYGVRVGRRMVLDTACRDYRLPQVQPDGRIAWETLGRYPPWVSVRRPDVSPTHPVTSGFAGLDLLWPSPLEPLPVAGVRAEVLAQTTSAAWVMDEPFVIDPFRVPQGGSPVANPSADSPAPSSAPGQRVLALALTGSGFTRLIVVGDDDFASDLMQFSDSLYNVFFLENAVLWLSGNEDLLSIRTRAPVEGRLDRIEDAAVRRRVMLTSEVLNVAVLPVLVLLFGVARLLRRREKGPPPGATDGARGSAGRTAPGAARRGRRGGGA